MQKLKLQYFGHLMWRTDSLEKTLMLGKIEVKKRREWQRMRCLDGITDLMDMCLRKFHKLLMNREAWQAAVHGITKNRTPLSDWTELNVFYLLHFIIKKKKSSIVCFNQGFLKIMYIRVSSSLYTSSWEPHINLHWSELSSAPFVQNSKGWLWLMKARLEFFF